MMEIIAFRVLGGIVNYQLGKIGASRITGSTEIWCDA
jgi:membrane protein YqaA with SNARE-associated domain